MKKALILKLIETSTKKGLFLTDDPANKGMWGHQMTLISEWINEVLENDFPESWYSIRSGSRWKLTLPTGGSIQKRRRKQSNAHSDKLDGDWISKPTVDKLLKWYYGFSTKRFEYATLDKIAIALGYRFFIGFSSDPQIKINSFDD